MYVYPKSIYPCKRNLKGIGDLSSYNKRNLPFFVLVLIKRKLPVCAAITLYATLVSLCLEVAFWHKVQELVAKTLFAE